MSPARKPSVANYRDFKEYPKIEAAYSTHLVVVGKRNPFAEPDAESKPDPEVPLAE